MPIVNTLLSNEAGNEQGFVSGLSTTYTSIGNIIGSIMAGNLFDMHINLPYIVAAFILFGAIFLAKEKRGLQKKETAQNELLMVSKSNE